MASTTPRRSERRVVVTVRCTRPNCRGLPIEWSEEVPWYLTALPILRIHVAHGGCVGHISYDLREA